MINRIACLLTLVLVSGCASLEMFHSPTVTPQPLDRQPDYQSSRAVEGTVVAPQTEIVNRKKSVSILQKAPVAMPLRGLKMAQVRNDFGSPMKQLAAVGEPPITRWVYEEFTVYFEHQYVIDSVTHVTHSHSSP